jgi:hypothetical protein
MYFLNRVKQENRNQIKLYFLETANLSYDWIKTDIEYEVIPFHGSIHIGNYSKKFEFILSQQHPYCVKLDEDYFISNYVWDFIIENVEILDNKQLLSLSPVTNIGVPTTDLFIEDFCEEWQKQEIHKIFLGVDFAKTCGQRWGTNEYDELNKHTIGAQQWNITAFHNDLDALSTNIKGVHPVRFSYEAQKYLADVVLSNVPRFISQQYFIIDTQYKPYMCNDMCVMRADVLRDIDKEEKFIPYDEIPINNYKRKYKLDYAFIRKGFGVHTMFAFVGRYNIDRQPEEVIIHDTLLKLTKECNHYEL